MNAENTQKYFLEAYDTYADAIFRYCYGQTSNRELGLDLAQDTFTKAWEYLRSGKTVENLKPFLYKIATNLIIDYRRKKKPISLDKLTEEGFDYISDKDEQAEKEIIFEGKLAVEAIGKLDTKYRNVLMLKYVDEMSIKEIAEIVGESENNVSVRIHRGLEKLKEILNNE